MFEKVHNIVRYFDGQRGALSAFAPIDSAVIPLLRRAGGQASATPVRLLHVVSSPSFPPSINHTSICFLSKEQQGKLLTLCAFWGDIRL